MQREQLKMPKQEANSCNPASGDLVIMKSGIAKCFSSLVLSAFLLALSACASSPTVRMEMDRSADFSQYKTFGFVSPLGTDRDGYQSIVSQDLKAATQREMEARGMTLDTNAPQLLVNFNASLDDKFRVTSVPTNSGMAMGGYYGYRMGMYGAWPLYNSTTVVTQYQQGTLNIDVVDAARKQLVWESVVTNSVSQKDLDNMQAAIDRAVAAAFAKYPVSANAADK
jgi:hypothetical protein